LMVNAEWLIVLILMLILGAKVAFFIK